MSSQKLLLLSPMFFMRDGCMYNFLIHFLGNFPEIPIYTAVIQIIVTVQTRKSIKLRIFFFLVTAETVTLLMEYIKHFFFQTSPSASFRTHRMIQLCKLLIVQKYFKDCQLQRLTLPNLVSGVKFKCSCKPMPPCPVSPASACLSSTRPEVLCVRVKNLLALQSPPPCLATLLDPVQ